MLNKRWLLGGAVLVLLGVEAGLRWGVGLGEPPLARLDDQSEYELVRDASYSRWGNRIEINAAGMRAPPLSVPQPENERRILLIGDSVIYGGHFLDQPETIAYRMTDELAIDACLVTVLPVAVSSWGPENQRGFLAREGTFGASVAGLVVSGHDIADVPTGGSGIVPYRTRAPLSAIEDALTAVIERVFPATPQSAPLTFEERTRISLAALDALEAQLSAANVALVMFYHPTMPERAEGLWEAAEVFQNWAAQKNVPFVDLSSLQIDPSMYDDHIHPNAIGAARLAKGLAQTLGPKVPAC